MSQVSFEDLPCKWPWQPQEIKPVTDEAPAAASNSGRGRGRGRGRSKTAETKLSESGTDSGSKKQMQPPDDMKVNSGKGKTQGPFLLTNLVRTGNQTGGASTWKIMKCTLKTLISERLTLVPFSERGVEADARLQKNINTMKFLGKVPEDFALDLPDQDSLQKQPAKLAKLCSAIEFLQSQTQNSNIASCKSLRLTALMQGSGCVSLSRFNSNSM